MTTLGFRRALGLGVSGAFAEATPALLLGLAALASTCCTSLVWLQALAALVDEGAGPRFLGLLLAATVACLLEACILGASVWQAARGLRGQAVPPFLEALWLAAPRALGWAVLTTAALLAWTGWEVLVGGAGMLLFLRGLLHGSGGLAGALGLALVGTLGPLVGLFLQLVVEVALVRSVLRDEPASVALFEAGRALLARPFVYVGLLALTAVLAAAVSGAAAALSGMGPTPSLRLLRGTAVLQLCIASLASAVALLVRLDAFVALELARTDELPLPPPPPAPPPVPRAELVLDATAVLEARAVGTGPGGG